MGMFDSYYTSKKFKCPSCGTEQGGDDDDFQSKELDCVLKGYKLGAKLSGYCQYRYIDWYHYCNGTRRDKDGKYTIVYDTEPVCKDVSFVCRTFIDSTGFLFKEAVYVIDREDDDKNWELIYQKEV